jgi:hypothetical protein
MVVDGHCELLLSGLLSDYVLVQVFLQFQRLGQFMRSAVGGFVTVVFKDGIADGYAFVTDIGPRIIAG